MIDFNDKKKKSIKVSLKTIQEAPQWSLVTWPGGMISDPQLNTNQ